MRFTFLAAAVVVCGVVVTLQACTTSMAASTVRLNDPLLTEASGLARSQLQADRLWLLNDSQHSATLFALGRDGEPHGRLAIDGIRNRDWEDLASFRWDDRAWLMIADIGDNAADNHYAVLHFIEEPAFTIDQTSSVSPTASVRISYPDGPHDAEAVAVDVANGEILLISKRDDPARLYALPLATILADPKTLHVAEFRGELPWDGVKPSLAKMLSNPRLAATHGLATAMDVSTDGLRAVVLGYSYPVLLQRRRGQAWTDAVRRQLPPHGLFQAEAIAFNSAEDAVIITTEGVNAPLVEISLD